MSFLFARGEQKGVGCSIARALNCKFFRFSVGGLADVAKIKGHRRTYIWCYAKQDGMGPKNAGTANLLVLIDEICKIPGSVCGISQPAKEKWWFSVEVQEKIANVE